MLMPDRIVILALISAFIDYCRIQFNYSIVSLFIFINLIGLYFIIHKIHININMRYGDITQ